MTCLIGIDIGTSGAKTALFDETGKLLASYTGEYPLYQPQNGYAEQDPADWWEATVDGIRTVLEKSGVSASDVKGIGLSGQMHGLVMLDSECEVLRRSIIWCDQRTATECEEITTRVGARRLMDITMSPALTGFTASKILWVRNHEPEIYAKCRHILLPKDYIRHRLTGEFATEVSDASGMQLLDIAGRQWSDEVLSALDIDRSLLAEVHESPAVTGVVSSQAAALTGLAAGTPVVGGAGDCAAGAVGAGVVRDGQASASIGTSGVVFAHTSRLSPDHAGRVHTFCTAVPGAWHVMGVTQGAGLSLKWFRDNFCISEKETAAMMGVDPYYLMDKAAENISIGADRLLYLPYLMGERTPHLDPNARGLFFGLSAIHTRAHLLRAVMEGVIYSLRDCLSVFEENGIRLDSIMACGGGGVSSLWRQMLADVFDCPVRTAVSAEGGALGAAILAGVGVGVYASVEQGCDAVIRIRSEQTPIPQNTALYQPYYRLYSSLYEKIQDDCAVLASL